MKYRIMTFNLKTSKSSFKRRNDIYKIIKNVNADIIGIQECSFLTLKNLQLQFKEYIFLTITKKYAPFEDHNVIIVKKNIFKILDIGKYDLSLQNKVPTKKRKTSFQKRICTYVKLATDNHEFIFLNTHLDFLLPCEKTHQIAVIKDHINLTKTLKILVGDFNMSYNKTIKNFEEQTGLNDILKNKQITTFKYLPFPLDHIFIDKGITFELFFIKNKSFFAYKASDHYPLIIDIKLP